MELIFICFVCIIIGVIIGENSSSSKRRSYENHNPPKGPPPLKFKKSLTFDESPVQRNHNRDGPLTPKPEIIPKGQSYISGYQPTKQQGTPEPPPKNP
jgi:hypothetical protein